MIIYGHAAAAGASAVAAVDYREIANGGNLHEVPGRIDVEPFSSLGGLLPFYFDAVGNPLPGAPVTRYKPDITAPDHSDTSFFIAGYDPDSTGFPNFPGTSAAAPHAAGVAALLLDHAVAKGATLSPEAVNNILHRTAIDMQDPGRYFLSGWGRVDANAALALVAAPAPASQILSHTDSMKVLPPISRRGFGLPILSDMPAASTIADIIIATPSEIVP